MSEAPDHELIVAAIAALRLDADLAILVEGRIFDRGPEKPTPKKPYIALGPTSSIPDDYDCMDGEEITIQFDVYSSGSGNAYVSAECRRIADRIKRVLHHAELDLPSNALVSLELSLKTIVREADGVTNHGVVQFTATVDTP